MSATLPALLQLEQVTPLQFRSRYHRENFRKTLFGGQVLAQGLMAACATCEDRSPHSIHAYFLLPGSSAKPVDFDVENVRNGRYFSHRRVTARQDGREIFAMMVSFHQAEGGFSHQQDAAIELIDPDVLAAAGKVEYVDTHLPPNADNPSALALEVISLDGSRFDSGAAQAPSSHFWLRCQEPLATPTQHLGALAFVSDIGLLASALLPHDTHVFADELATVTLDHAMWFHEREINLNEWTLFKIDSPWAGHARGLGRSQIYNRSGLLIASATQEGLMRSYPQASATGK